MNWEKVPAVTTGGKKYFHTAKTKAGRLWVVWNRIKQSWMLSKPGTQDTLVKSAEAGKRLAEKLYCEETYG